MTLSDQSDSHGDEDITFHGKPPSAVDVRVGVDGTYSLRIDGDGWIILEHAGRDRFSARESACIAWAFQVLAANPAVRW